MQVGEKLQVEVYAHGGWWKDSIGQTGQVPASEARKGPLATVAVVANRFGMDGWELVEAGPGEVLVSSTVRDLVAGSGIEFENRGTHTLKGVPGEWRLFAVVSI